MQLNKTTFVYAGTTLVKISIFIFYRYVSCVVGCPYEGKIQPDAVRKVCDSLLDLGCDELSLGDTIGVGVPATIEKMLTSVMNSCPVYKLAMYISIYFFRIIP